MLSIEGPTMDRIDLLQAYFHGNFKVMALKCIVPPKVVPKNVRKVAIHQVFKHFLSKDCVAHKVTCVYYFYC